MNGIILEYFAVSVAGATFLYFFSRLRRYDG